MLDLIENKRSEIAALCRGYRVRRLDVFGSATAGGFDPETSDVDFLVEYEPDPATLRFGAYFDLKDALEALLGRKVDLVVASAVENPFLRAGIDSTREAVFAP